MGLALLPCLVVANVSLFAWCDWQPTDGIEPVSAGFFFQVHSISPTQLSFNFNVI